MKYFILYFVHVLIRIKNFKQTSKAGTPVIFYFLTQPIVLFDPTWGESYQFTFHPTKVDPWLDPISLSQLTSY